MPIRCCAFGNEKGTGHIGHADSGIGTRFLSAQTVYYLLNFNLAPRQIWITRHGESVDNVNGRIGGDSDLSEKGVAYAKTLTSFIEKQRQAWDVHQRDKALSTHFPPLPGDTTPPNPEYNHGDSEGHESSKNFCVWTSMLKRSIQTAQFFDEDNYDTKQFKMLDELNAGTMEGLTYEEIRTKYYEEFRLRQGDKLHYRCEYITCGFCGSESLDLLEYCYSYTNMTG